MKGRRDYKNDLPSLKAQNRKLLAEREVLRDQTRTLLEEREQKDKALVKLWSIMADVKKELSFIMPIPDQMEWEELPSWVERLAREMVSAKAAEEKSRKVALESDDRAASFFDRLAQVQTQPLCRLVWERLKRRFTRVK